MHSLTIQLVVHTSTLSMMAGHCSQAKEPQVKMEEMELMETMEKTAKVLDGVVLIQVLIIFLLLNLWMFIITRQMVVRISMMEVIGSFLQAKVIQVRLEEMATMEKTAKMERA